MKILVVYESMFGSTRMIAESIAEGFGADADTRVVRAADAETGVFDGDLLIVGGPTHAWGMSRSRTRKGAPGYADKPGSGLVLEPGADRSAGVREWLEALPSIEVRAAAFDTRINMPPLVTGRASKAIARALKAHGATMVAPPESFLVDKGSHLVPGQTERARAWASELARALSPVA